MEVRKYSLSKLTVRGRKMRLKEVRGAFDYSKQLRFVVIIHFSFLFQAATTDKIKVPLNIPC